MQGFACSGSAPALMMPVCFMRRRRMNNQEAKTLLPEIYTRDERPGVRECSNCVYWMGSWANRCANRRDVLSCGVCLSFEEYRKPDEDLLQFFKIIEEDYLEILKKASTVVNDDAIVWRTKKDEDTKTVSAEDDR